jgi:hypothetical protein
MDLPYITGMFRWDYQEYEITIIDKITFGNIIYLKISVDSEVGKIYWVIRRIFVDARVFVVNEMKTFFNLPKLEMISAKISGRRYILINTFDPNVTNEVTLREYSKYDVHTTDLYIQAQNIFSFRRLMCMNKIDDSSILVRMQGCRIFLYSYVDTFENDGKPIIPMVTFNKWFTPTETSLSNATQRLLRCEYPRDNSQKEIDRFSDDVEPIIERIRLLIVHFDINFIWYVSDVNNYLLSRMSPRAM